MKATRTDVYAAIDSERQYQDWRWDQGKRQDRVLDKEKPIDSWLLYIEWHLNKAKERMYALDKEGACAEVRKVAALAVVCMEINGAPLREIP